MSICLPTKKTIQEATAILQSGGVVSFATETVYGLGCDTFNKIAIQKVYKLKNRPANNPMIAHILDKTWVDRLATGWNRECDKLADTFWPGPLTIVLPKKETVPKEACGGFDTIAIRCPANTTARLLLASFSSPISAPSANKSGHVSPTTAYHVEHEFGCDVMILDGGPSENGIESTVLSMVGSPTILRPGSILLDELKNTIGNTEICTTVQQIDSPGTSPRHYSPKTKAVLKSSDRVRKIRCKNTIVISYNTLPISCQQLIQMPQTATEYATKIYAALREADTREASQIVIEIPPSSPEWCPIHDRLSRCCAP